MISVDHGLDTFPEDLGSGKEKAFQFVLLWGSLSLQVPVTVPVHALQQAGFLFAVSCRVINVTKGLKAYWWHSGRRRGWNEEKPSCKDEEGIKWIGNSLWSRPCPRSRDVAAHKILARMGPPGTGRGVRPAAASPWGHGERQGEEQVTASQEQCLMLCHHQQHQLLH